MKIFMKIRICLILVTIQKIQNIFDPVNKKVIGKMKNKVKGKTINEFGGLKSKMYSLVVVGSEEIEKAKGINKFVVKNT